MSGTDRGQLTGSAPEIYEKFFVPALFGEWAPRVVDAAGVSQGHHVLDVACGTGIAAREAAKRNGDPGRVTGTDVNEGMLETAERNGAGIRWKRGAAESLPFEDRSFDAVLCQFALMFFEDRPAAVREMSRVLRPERRCAVAVWDSLENTPGYAAAVALIHRLFGKPTADLLRSPFCLGDPGELRRLFESGPFRQTQVISRRGTARFPSLRDWMFTDVRGWTLGDRIDDDQFERLVAEAGTELARFVKDDGSVQFDSPAHIVVAVA
jgi:SAM-dependent methyltransferase